MKTIFSTKQREKLLRAVIFKTNSISVNNTASRLKLSKGFVSKYFDVLVKNSIFKKTSGKFTIAVTSLVKGIKILLNIESINVKIFKKYLFVRTVGLYGSCAKGENSEDSDVDLWIKVENVSEEKLASLTSELNRKIRNVKILFLTDKKIERLKEGDNIFYYSLFFGSIVLYGNQDGI